MDKKIFDELIHRNIITHVGLNHNNYADEMDLVKKGIATSAAFDEVYNEIINTLIDMPAAKQAFFDAISAGGEVVLTSDILIDNADMINVTNEVILDLNGYTIKKTGMTESKKCVLFYVKGAGAKLTIKGEGNIMVYGGNTDIAVWSDKGAEVNIESGNFYGIGNANGSDLIYANGGKINISGGSFKLDNMDSKNFAEPQYSLINVYGANVETAKDYIVVTGGRFYKFDPANNVSEGTGTNFVADEFESIADGNWFEVKEINS